MSNQNDIIHHYNHGNLLTAITSGLKQLNKTPTTVSIEDLAPVDEFHIGGRIATDHLLSQINFIQQKHLLDIGCGLGGAARYIADKYKTSVSGIDLTSEYIETGNALSAWLGLSNKVDLTTGSATKMPFADNSFDGAYQLHVGMNIENKQQLFTEVFRVLQPGAFFAIYDVMQLKPFKEQSFHYPVPWASNSTTSFVASINEYKDKLSTAGFTLVTENNRRDFALNFFNQVKEKMTKSKSLPPLGLHTLMQSSTSEKLGNMMKNINNGYIAPVEIIVKKPIKE